MDAAATPPVDDDAAALSSPFIGALVRMIRAHDAFGTWEGRPDQDLLKGYIVTKEQRRAMPIIGDPDEKVLWRLEQFYNALGLTIEARTGIVASPLIKISGEGFGRIVLFAGRLVVISRTLRDVHRFGFETLSKMASEGEKLVDDAVAYIERYPEVAKL